jgi:DNA-binding PadR family transcriptional regulator
VDETSDSCRPVVVLPSWWSGFLFHVLNPRQISIYTYLTMLCDDAGSCRPTIDQIRDDLGLYSSTMVFDALSTLESLGFIVRERQSLGDARSRRNVYRRTACEFTILRLLESGRIDGALRPVGADQAAASAEGKVLADEGLRYLLGERMERYERATPAARGDVLVEELRAALAARSRGNLQ